VGKGLRRAAQNWTLLAGWLLGVGADRGWAATGAATLERVEPDEVSAVGAGVALGREGGTGRSVAERAAGRAKVGLAASANSRPTAKLSPASRAVDEPNRIARRASDCRAGG
jgi:hypothetical protein